MEIKTQNLSRMSKEQLYRLLVQKEISEEDRKKVKNELVKREADILYNQAQRVRGGEPNSKPVGPPVGIGKPGSAPAPGQSPKKKFTISPQIWLYIVFLVFVLGFLLYTVVSR